MPAPDRSDLTTATSLQTIAVIDDDPLCVVLVRLSLARIGYRVVPCPPRPTALARIVELNPAAVVLDVHMPELDGIDFFCRLRSDPVTQRLPVIFVTASPQDVRKRLPHFTRQDAYLLAKPYGPLQLQTVVQTVMEARSSVGAYTP